MNVDDLLTLFDYDRWANRRLLEAAEQLSPEEFTRGVGGAYGSVRTTLVHIMEVERGWVARCDGDMGWPDLNPEDFPSLESVREEWRSVEQVTRGIMSRLAEGDLGRVVPYQFEGEEPRTARVAEVLQHAANHAAHHRGQVTLMLRMLGHAPGNLDMLFYYVERFGGPAE
ncbi:MAG: DinB family protein [Blastocatellia bacterium]